MELARFAATAKVTAIERMGKERRAATLRLTKQSDAVEEISGACKRS